MTEADLDQAPDEPLGDHVLELQIAEVVDETDDARSLVFAVPDESGDPEIPPQRLRYAPGQFLTLRVPSDRTGSVARCYSLCSSPFTDDALTVTVKRTVDGYASNWLCDHAHKGMRIHVLAPSGNFVPKTLDDNFLLLAAGSGITPIMSICKSALSEGSGQVTLVYANRDDRSVIFADALRELAAKYPDRLTVRALAGIGAGAAEHRRAGDAGHAVHRSARVHLWARPVHGRGPPGSRNAESACATGAYRGVQVAGLGSVRGGDDRGQPTRATSRRPPPWCSWTAKPTPCRGRAAPSCSTSCSPRVWMHRSPAVRATAAHVPAPCAAAK